MSLELAGLGAGWGCAVEHGDGARPDVGSSLRAVCQGKQRSKQRIRRGKPTLG